MTREPVLRVPRAGAPAVSKPLDAGAPVHARGPENVGTPEKPWKRPDASMTLLIEVMERPLDPGYAAAARARAQGSARPRSAVGRGLIFACAVAIGLGGVWAARELRAPVPAEANPRLVLVEEIRERSAISDELSARNDALRAEIGELQEAALGSGAQRLLEESAQLAILAGTTEVTGPGLVVTLEDSERAQRNEPDTEDQRVNDFDLQVVVNGLWASGAEAIAVNGHRLTALTAIRTAGQAVLVDLEPLISPYVVEAIGDPQAMEVAFARTSASAHLSTLSSAFSIPSEVGTADDLVLPAGTSTRLDDITESR